MNDLLKGVGDGEQDPSAASGGLGCDDNGKVAEERVGDEGTREAAYVSIRPEAVCREALETSDEGDGGGQGHSNELCEV